MVTLLLLMPLCCHDMMLMLIDMASHAARCCRSCCHYGHFARLPAMAVFITLLSPFLLLPYFIYARAPLLQRSYALFLPMMLSCCCCAGLCYATGGCRCLAAHYCRPLIFVVIIDATRHAAIFAAFMPTLLRHADAYQCCLYLWLLRPE